MGLFDAIRKQLLKVIEWKDDTENTIVYRYPIQESRDEIMNGCQLIVTESQVAILVKHYHLQTVLAGWEKFFSLMAF